ncbi:MAG: hypothetical protein PVI23_06220 [Maricaulaceae bacterium]|jgi:hypothetical protein
MLIVLVLGMIAATAACLTVVALGFAVWPAAMIAALSEGVVAEQGLRLALGLAGPLAIAAGLHLSWKAYARAKPARCTELMMATLVLSLAVFAGLNGVVAL